MSFYLAGAEYFHWKECPILMPHLDQHLNKHLVRDEVTPWKGETGKYAGLSCLRNKDKNTYCVHGWKCLKKRLKSTNLKSPRNKFSKQYQSSPQIRQKNEGKVHIFSISALLKYT